MPAADHADVLIVFKRVPADHGDDMLFEMAKERILDLPVDEQIIRGDAGLAAVEQLAEGDALCRQIELGGAVHDAGALAAQLERYGREMLAGSAHDLAADGHAAGEEDIVKPLIQQRLILPAAALDHGDILRREAVGDQRADDGGGCGRIGRGLDDAAVTRGDGADERLQGEHERIIPRRHDQHDAVGIMHREAARMELRQRGENAVLLRPAAHVRKDVIQLGERHADFAHVAFRGGFIQIGLQRCVDFGFAGEDGAAELFEGRAAEEEIERFAFAKIAALCSDDFCDVHETPPSA